MLGPNDPSAQAIRNAEAQVADEDPPVHIGCTVIDLPPITADNIHHTPRGQRSKPEDFHRFFGVCHKDRDDEIRNQSDPPGAGA